MIKYKRICFTIASILLLNGCGSSLFTSRETNPSIRDMTISPHFWPWSPSAVNTFATTASRRVVIVKSQEYGAKITSCAEPSPDVGETFALAISNAIKVAATDPSSGINGSLSNDYAKMVATQITPLIYRTQALQLYRDAIHKHCIDRMNGWYDNIDSGEKVTLGLNETDVPINDYNAVKLYLFNKTIEVLKVELPLVLKAQEEFFKAKVNAGFSTEALKEMASIIKSTSNNVTIKTTKEGTSIEPSSIVKNQ